MSGSTPHENVEEKPACPNCSSNSHGRATRKNKLGNEKFYCASCEYKWNPGDGGASYNNPQKFTATLSGIVKANQSQIEQFPKDQFRFYYLDDDLRSLFYRLRRHGAIEEIEEGEGNEPSIWRLTKWFREGWRQYASDRPTTPCGEMSIHCLKKGELYTCTDDDCDCRFGRELAEKVTAH